MSGIGYECALTFARHGANVVVVDRDREAALRAANLIVKAGGVCLPVVADALIEEEVAAAVGETLANYGRIDVVQNNIGMIQLGGPEDLSLEEWRRAIAVNLDTVFLGAKFSLPHLVKARGSMINVSSIASIRWTGYAYPAYSSAKAAVNQLTQSLAILYADAGVRVNAILAGVIDTPLVYRELSGNAGVEDMRAARDAMSPTGSMGTARDVAGAALFLASDQSSYVNGALLPVDGGLHVRAG